MIAGTKQHLGHVALMQALGSGQGSSALSGPQAGSTPCH